jgi:hypothetical protein
LRSQWGVCGVFAQSASTRQIPQMPRCVSQSGAVDGQSLFCKHWTHVLSLVSQIFASWLFAQSPLLEQPARQWNSFGSQMGCALPQSPFERHSTHAWSPRKQRGDAMGQSLFDSHSTQRASVLSQIAPFWLPTQS